MHKSPVFTETVISTVKPEKTMRIADECLLAIRLVESKKVSAHWVYEFEVHGEFGRIEKFKGRLADLETELL